MSVYIISGPTLTLTGNGSVNGGNITVANTVNPITGGMGIETVRIVNTSTSNIATFTYTPSDVTYEFTDVASQYIVGSGVGATFDVTVGNGAVSATLVDGGSGYQFGDTVKVLGTAVGGASPANDIVISVVNRNIETGAMTEIAVDSGTPAWPQSTTGTIAILPRTDEFIQVTSNASIGCYFSANIADGNLLVTPVTVL